MFLDKRYSNASPLKDSWFGRRGFVLSCCVKRTREYRALNRVQRETLRGLAMSGWDERVSFLNLLFYFAAIAILAFFFHVVLGTELIVCMIWGIMLAWFPLTHFAFWSFYLDKLVEHVQAEREGEEELYAFLASDLHHPCEAGNAVMSPSKKACLTLLMIGVLSAWLLLYFVGRAEIALFATMWAIFIVPWRSLLGKHQ